MILLVCHSLTAGGAERVLSRMANHWATEGKPVAILTLAPMAQDFFRLDPRVQRIALDLAHGSPSPLAAIRNNLHRVRALRAAFRRLRPSVVISFMDRTNVLALMAARGLALPVIVSERTDPRQRHIGSAWEWLRRIHYRRAHALVVQTAALRPWGERMIAAERVAVIPNPVPPPAEAPDEGDRAVTFTPYVAAMGRLLPVKGFDLLLDAFALCGRDQPDWNLLILGEGPERANLLQQAQRLGIADRVHLPGVVKNPAPILRGADIFVLSSRYEGFPNALLEAMSFGVAAISFDCPTGPAEMIRHQVDGLLVPAQDSPALARAMHRLMSDPAARAQLATQARSVLDRFAQPKIMAQWDDLIARATDLIPARQRARARARSTA